MIQRRADYGHELSAIAGAAVVLTPSHFMRIGVKVLARDMMVNTLFSTADTREERLRLIGASAIQRIGFLMVYAHSLVSDFK